MKIVCSAIVTLLATFSVACDPNSKVVRSKQEDPQGIDGKKDGKKDPNKDSNAAAKEGDKTGSSAAASASPSAAPIVGDQVTDPGVPKAGAKDPSGSQASGAVASGKCDTGDWGACFREARPFVSSEPKKAIDLYLKACLPGEKAGDGLACRAAAVLSKASGNGAGATQYFKAACEKEKFPVLGSCREL